MRKFENLKISLLGWNNIRRIVKLPGRKKFVLISVVLIGIGIGFWYSLPRPIFSDSYSTVVTDRNNELLGARIADDGQWRFPMGDSLPDRYKKSLILFEDKYFYSHPGINPIALFSSLIRNLKAGKVISGGSTISMQVIRLSRKGKPRNICQKIIEIVQAMRMEISYSKEEILLLYSAHAPFGGNIVGIEAASWRYFGRNSNSLSWSEAAVLAVLPNSPSLVRPGRNIEKLKAKRDRLLERLFAKGTLDSLSYKLSIEEPLPDDPFPLPQLASHLVAGFFKQSPGSLIRTSISKVLQDKVECLMEIQKDRLYSNEIHNAACLVIDVKNGEVLAYYGNIRNEEHPEYGGEVDVVHSPRSSGSILKPFLFAEMIDKGEILPGTLIADIPTFYGNFSPKNNSKSYDGAVPARAALSRSLNIPAVRMLRKYGVDRFYHDLKILGLSTLTYSPDRYGLSLILGGAETRLWELAGIYSGFSRILNHFNEKSGKYFLNDLRMPEITYDPRKKINKEADQEQGIIGAGSIFLTFKALTDVNRPEDESGWENFSSSRKIAWKTGTSFGFRDAWAVGITPEYTVAVWTGNANGEGRPGLTGLHSSAPILFEIFNLLPSTSWFKVPYDDLAKIQVCSKSGFLTGQDCPETDSVWVPVAGMQTPVCPYHQIIHLDKKKKQRVSSFCYPVSDMVHESWFILPPAQEWYYKQKNAWYRELPAWRQGCKGKDDISQMQMIYPETGTIVYVPYELDGSRGKLICEAVHRKTGATIFWHLDDTYLGQTKGRHQMALLPEKGKHVLSLVDEDGGRISVQFEAIERTR
jgi:penicillin-binding protein 1C